MNVFISWSGPESKPVAAKLSDWIPQILQNVTTWMSAEDISAGQRPFDEIAAQLAQCTFGILCITPENLESKWIHFEAGAISKAVGKNKVVPLCIRMKPSQLTYPLAQFQGMEAKQEGIGKLIESINADLKSPRPARDVEKALPLYWPELQAVLDAAPAPRQVAPKRDPNEMIEEILTIVRAQIRVTPTYRGVPLEEQQESRGSLQADTQRIHYYFENQAYDVALSVREFSVVRLIEEGTYYVRYSIENGPSGTMYIPYPLQQAEFQRIIHEEILQIRFIIAHQAEKVALKQRLLNEQLDKEKKLENEAEDKTSGL